MTEVKGTDVKGKVITLTKSQPEQLSLFRTFISDDDKYSNTLELYDAIPKYFASTKEMEALRMVGKDKKTGDVVGRYLKALERTFIHRGEKYKVTIKPARLKDENGREVEYYPTEREELVEEALKKLACDQLNGVYLDNFVGVQFTLQELQRELKKRGHSIHLRNLVEALTIGNGASINVERSDGDVVMKSSMFPSLLLTRRKEWLENPKCARCYVQFNALATHSINQLTYRHWNAHSFIGAKSTRSQ